MVESGIPGKPDFLAEFKKSLRPDIPIIEVNAHINDDKLALVACEQLLEVMGAAGEMALNRVLGIGIFAVSFALDSQRCRMLLLDVP